MNGLKQLTDMTDIVHTWTNSTVTR